MSFIPIVVLAFMAFLFFSTVKIVQEKSAKVVQRLGSFSRVLHPGINFCVPFLETIAGTLSLKVQQINVPIETKTKDNVFVKMQVFSHLAACISRKSRAGASLQSKLRGCFERGPRL